MRLEELQLFLLVSEHQSIRRAAEKSSTSPASLSRAMVRLEQDLGVTLFENVGRSIELNPKGKLLQKLARELLESAKNLKYELANDGEPHSISIAGRSALLSEYAVKIVPIWNQSISSVVTSFYDTTDEDAFKAIESSQVHFSMTTQKPPNDLLAFELGQFKMVTCVGKGHLLLAEKKGKPIPIKSVLKYPFVTSDNYIFGNNSKTSSSTDGWRDDVFPRNIQYVTQSLSTMESLVLSNLAVGYLPEFRAQALPVEILKISGCEFECSHKVYFSRKRSRQASYIQEAFDMVRKSR
jgi:DNA-binding transcriptional LysR family regulator